MALSQNQKTAALLGGILVLSAVAVKGSGLIKLGKELDVDVDTTAQVRNSQLVISSTPTLKNPTSQGIRLSHPFVTIQFEQKAEIPFASSELNHTSYTLRGHSELTLAPITFKIGLTDLFGSIPKLIRQIEEKKAIEIYVKLKIQLTRHSIPITKNEVYSFPVSSLNDLINLAIS